MGHERQDWNVEAVQDWEKLHETHLEREISAALAWYLLDIGISRVNESNFKRIMRRIRQVEGAIGPKLRIRDANGDFPLTPITEEQVRRRFGMVAYVSLRTEAEFKKLIDRELALKARYEEQYGKTG